MDSHEVELKLRVDPAHLARLQASPILTQGARNRGTTRTLDSTYYDTGDLRLFRRAVSLRVRRLGRRFIQTLKAGNGTQGSGLLDRREWEAPVASPEPDLTQLADGPARECLGLVSAAELKPVFTTHVKRQVRRLNGADGTDIEVAIDQGEIRTADGAVLPVAEVELEMKHGDPAALFDLALKLVQEAPLRLEWRSKAERGYALVAGDDGAAAVKAGPLDLPREATAEQALERIVRHCLRHLLANEACALKGEDPEGIHQMRVALRRLRSALALFRKMIPPPQYQELVGEVKWLAAALGPARDWDVFRQDLLAPVRIAFPDSAELAALDEAVAACRAHAHDHARAAILSPRYTVLLLRLGAWLEARAWRVQPVTEDAARLFEPVIDLADRLLAKRHKAARRRGAGFAGQTPEERHELRIALKKLRYAIEFFRPLYPEKPVRRYLKQLGALQDDLGHLNDVATARRLLASLEEGAGATASPVWRTGAGIVIGWHARGLAILEPHLVEDWHDFAAAKPFWSTPS